MNDRKTPVIVLTKQLIMPRLTIYYPVIAGLSNYLIQEGINRIIYREVYNQIHKQGYFQNPRTEITANYELKTNERSIISLSLINYAFSGGAHGLTIQNSLTFNVDTGKLYNLAELFKPNSNYVSILSEIVKKQIAKRNIPTLGQFNSIKPNQDFYISDKSLILYFQLYELTPYVYGFPYFPISVYDIQNIIDENGPLGKMVY